MAARDEADRKAEARAFADQVDALVSATLRGGGASRGCARGRRETRR
jgi:hypothetical protein